MEIQHLKSFSTLLREKSFSRAARALFLTQPAISQHIRALENELGEKLIDRTTKQAVATDAGRLLESRIPAIFESLDSIRSEISARKGLMQGALRIVCGDTVAAHLLPRVIAPFWMKYPRLDITVHNSPSEGIVSALLQREAEIGIATLPVRNRFLQVFPLLAYHEVAVSAPDKKRSTVSITLKELCKERLLLLETGTRHRTMLDAELKRQGIQPSSVLSFSSVAVQKAFAATGIGTAIVPDFAVREELKRGMLSLSKISDLRQKEIGAVTRVRRELSPAGNALLEVLKGFKF